MSKSSYVKCKFCSKKFNREEEEYVKISNRYAHSSCYDLQQKEVAEKRQVTDLILELYKPYEPDWGMIGQQLSRYKDAGMTYPGMYYSLKYFFVIKGNDIHKSKGIGIIPYIYDKAKAYYKNADDIHTKVESIKDKEIEVEQTTNVVVIQQKKPKKKLIDFSY